MRPRLVPIILALLLATATVSADEVGTVTFVQSFPEVVRDGRTLVEDVDFGFRVENLDAIRTDERSALELELDAATGIDATIAVEPDTYFALEVSDLLSEQDGSIELIAGTVNVVARRLAGDSRFEVRTPGATMGVRGTTFAVSTAPGGEILVTTEEGLVEVTNPTGRSLFASPGEAVEVDESTSLFRTVRYDREQIAAFRAEWRERRAALFIERAPELLRFWGSRYRRARDEFVEAYAQLMRRRDVIDEWLDEDRRGVRPRIERLQDRVDLRRAVVRVRAAMVRFEPILARLDRMAPFVRGFAADVELEPGFTAADLYRTVNDDRRVMAERIATVRHVLKLYGIRNGGRIP